MRLSRFQKLGARRDDQHSGFTFYLDLPVTLAIRPQIVSGDSMVFRRTISCSDHILTHGPDMLQG